MIDLRELFSDAELQKMKATFDRRAREIKEAERQVIAAMNGHTLLAGALSPPLKSRVERRRRERRA